MSDDFQGAPPTAEMPPPTPPMPPMGGVVGGSGPESDTSKLLAALGYVIWVVALIAILIEPYKNEKWVKAHAVQALGLNLAIYVISAITMPIMGLGGIVALVGFIYTIILAVKAYNGESLEVPIIYNLVKQYI